ncbi:MAG: hypothetical protein WDM90_23305 [Ferruginibacter sp.]
MKKADVLQLAIVLVGIIFGFLTLQYLFSSLFGIFTWIFSGGYGADSYLAPGISIYAVIGLQALCCWVLITQSGKLAAYLHEKSNLGTGFKITGNIQSLLYVVLIAIGIYLLLSNLNPLISTIFQNFKDRVANDIYNQDQRPVEWIRLILDVLLPGLLLLFAKPIAGYFAKNIGEETVIIEEEITETTEP